jgi:hypothetical protein
MRFPAPPIAILALGLLILLASPARSTQVQYRSIEALGAESALVVRGEVTGTRAYWNDAHTRILTETTVSVSESYKGSGPRELRLVQMGGVFDGVKMTVAGSLAWQPGENVVLFLEDSLPGRYRVAGFSQGKYRVERDPRTGEEFVRQDGLGEAELVGAPARGSESRRIPLQSLLSRALPELKEGE